MQLELRDYLALERTILSNERTLLSYLQNGLGFSVAGFTLIYAIGSQVSAAIGILLIIVGVAVAAVGFFRFKKTRRRLDIASPAETAEKAAAELSCQTAESSK